MYTIQSTISLWARSLVITITGFNTDSEINFFIFRGARHGHKMKAKLKRIADMEEKLIAELKSKTKSSTNVEKVSKQNKKVPTNEEEEMSTVENTEKVKRKKKKNKKSKIESECDR